MDQKQIILYALGGIIAFFILSALYRGVVGRKMLKERLTKEYQQALKGTDRQKALTAGMEYYRFFRSDGKITVYDQQAISNDMKTMPQEKMTVVVDQSNNVIDQLERLTRLKEKGSLTEAEFLEQKAKILNA